MTPEQKFHQQIKEIMEESQKINDELTAAIQQLKGYIMPEPVEQKLPELTEIIERKGA